MAPSLSQVERERIIALRQSGLRVKDICDQTGVTRKTVYFWLRRWEESGTIEAHHRQRFERATTAEEDAAIVAAHSADPFLSTRATSSTYNVSLDTVRRRLKEAGKKCCRPAKKIELNAHHKEARFRRSVKDIMKPEHNDQFLLRWLRARQWDPEAAEKMLRDSMKWREKWGVDTTLHTWQAPEVLEKHFPSGSTGFDKEGSPVIIVPFVGLDVWGLLHSITRSDVIRMVLKHLENYLASARKQALAHGPAALKVTVIFDLEGFNMRQYAWKPAAEMVFTLLQIYEANYPEILKTCFIVNAPKVFALAFSVIKKFMHEYTISKIKIYGSDAKKWQAQVLKIVDTDQLPVHYGGTMVDENGDPRCSAIVKPGGKVPKSYYLKNSSGESKKEYHRVTIKTGEKHAVDLLCADQESVLKWEFGVDSHDIKFLIMRRDEDGNESVVHGPRKVHEGPLDVGVLPVTGPATYSVIFDNKNAYLRNKKVFYDVLISVPAKDLNISDMPEDTETSEASSSTNL